MPVSNIAGIYELKVYELDEGTFSPYLIADAFPYQNKIYLSVGIFIQINPDEAIDPPLIELLSIFPIST